MKGDPLADERAAALAQIEALTREFDSVVAASKASNADDEHDPEGATIAFERQQVVALLDQARRRLADVDAALAHREAGDVILAAAQGALDWADVRTLQDVVLGRVGRATDRPNVFKSVGMAWQDLVIAEHVARP